MSLDEIREAVIDEFKDKLTDVVNQISQRTNALIAVDREIDGLQSQLNVAQGTRQEHNKVLNQLNKRKAVLEQSVTKLESGDIIIRNKP